MPVKGTCLSVCVYRKPLIYSNIVIIVAKIFANDSNGILRKML